MGTASGAVAMAVVLLVHGSWHGGWVWAGIGRALAGEVQRVLAPSLRGLGEDAAGLEPSIGLWTHVADLAALVARQDLAELVLVGHSYGGAVVQGLEGRLGDRVRAVVHLEGALPAPGRSIMDLWHPAYCAEILALAAAHDGWRVPPPDPASWTGLSPDQQRWLRGRLTPQSLKTYQDAMPQTLALAACPHYYLWAEDRPTRPYQAVVERVRGQAGWSVVATTGGHELPLTNPPAVLRVIRAALRGDSLPAAL